jgi:uncharacterized metal-binding protein (TIGR02443 family)
MPRNSLSDQGIKKQFIAGARCTACQEVDSTLWIHGVGVDYTHCVSCAHETTRPLLGAETEAQQAADSISESVVIFKPSPVKKSESD